MIAQFVKVGEEFPEQEIPPPGHPKRAPPWFPMIVQLFSVGEEFSEITPPWEFSAIVQFVRVGEEFSEQVTPPPEFP